MDALRRKRAILVVSFGTSYSDAREKTIDVIERQIGECWPEWQVYRAWTSQRIIQRLKAQEQMHIFTVAEAMEQILLDGVEELVVQPTHIIGGIENDRMKEDVLRYDGRYLRIRFGEPLLSSDEDMVAFIRTLMDACGAPASDEALVFMGHGTDHSANAVYAALDEACKMAGYPNVYVGTMEDGGSVDALIKRVAKYRPARVVLMPFLLVAGAHARREMAGEGERSWKCQFERAGFRVECVQKGLGEYSQIRGRYLAHLARAMES